MMWFQKKSKQAGSPENTMENFESMYRQETNIHRKWQEIEDAALRLKRKYEAEPNTIEFIDYIRVIEKAFAKGKIKGWTNEQIREELVKNNIEDLSRASKSLDKDTAEMLHEDFRKMHATLQRVNEVARQLLEKYADDTEYHSFIQYLRDVYIAFLESKEVGESAQGFKDRLITIRMDLLSHSGDMDKDAMQKIYEEFQQAVLG